jgi:hypothetical protein
MDRRALRCGVEVGGGESEGSLTYAPVTIYKNLAAWRTEGAINSSKILLSPEQPFWRLDRVGGCQVLCQHRLQVFVHDICNGHRWPRPESELEIYTWNGIRRNCDPAHIFDGHSREGYGVTAAKGISPVPDREATPAENVERGS